MTFIKLDANLASADELSVKLLQLGIQQCIALADESGLHDTAARLHDALDGLGGELPPGGSEPPVH